MTLATYAVQAGNSKGRLYEMSGALDRDEFERDRSRIIHSKAFRRLQGKTQVFANQSGDECRTRLTHSLEVAQVAKSIARSLNLNESLAETIALAHDMGHAPFGHLGQDVLDEIGKDVGGFEHNMHTLNLGMEIESPYPGYQGLNLTYETYEGMLKHCSKRRAKELLASDNEFLQMLGKRFLDKKSPSLEAQVVDWADAISYLHADLEDALRLKILTPQQISDESPKFAKHWASAQAKNIFLDEEDEKVIHETIRNMMSEAILDLVETSRAAITQASIQSLEDVRNALPLIQFSPKELKEHLLFKHVSKICIYDHPTVLGGREKSAESIKTLFDLYMEKPEQMPQTRHDDHRDIKVRAIETIACLMDDRVDMELTRLKSLDVTPKRKSSKP